MNNLQIMKRGIILIVLSIIVPFWDALAQGQADDHRLLESQEAREALTRENEQLRQTLQLREKELQRLRSLHADLILKSHEVIGRLEKLELEAAHLLGDRRAENVSGELAEMAGAMLLVRTRLLELETELGSFELAMAAVIDALQPSGAIRREVEEKLASLRKSLDEALEPLAAVDGRDTRDASQGCTVLSVDSEIHAAVFDKGYLQGLRNGMVLCLLREGLAIAKVKIVDCRATRAAGVLESGSWETIVPGMVLQQEAPQR